VARYWVIVVTTYYLFRLFLVILPKLDKRSNFEKITVIIQMIGMFLTIAGTAWSFYKHLGIVKYLLYIQASQMVISNYNMYDIE
jgi:hypothetical protein